MEIVMTLKGDEIFAARQIGPRLNQVIEDCIAERDLSLREILALLKWERSEYDRLCVRCEGDFSFPDCKDFAQALGVEWAYLIKDLSSVSFSKPPKTPSQQLTSSKEDSSLKIKRGRERSKKIVIPLPFPVEKKPEIVPEVPVTPVVPTLFEHFLDVQTISVAVPVPSVPPAASQLSDCRFNRARFADEINNYLAKSRRGTLERLRMILVDDGWTRSTIDLLRTKKSILHPRLVECLRTEMNK